jgi:hypothetical protein
MQQITVDQVFTAAAASFRQRLADTPRAERFASVTR